MGLLNEILTTIALLIVFLILFLFMRSNLKNIKEKLSEEKKNSVAIELNKWNNIFIVALAILCFSIIIDIYNELSVAENTYIHLLGVFKYAKISKGYINTMFVFSISELFIVLEIILLLLLNSNKKRIVAVLICILLYSGVVGIKLKDCYTVYRDGQKYTYINDFDVKKDIEENKEVSEEGALKAIRDEFEFDYISNVITEKANLENIKDETIKNSCNYEDFWIVSFDYMKNYEITKGVCALVDLKSGQVSFLTYPEGWVPNQDK